MVVVVVFAFAVILLGHRFVFRIGFFNIDKECGFEVFRCIHKIAKSDY